MEMKKADRSDLRSQALDLLRFPLAVVIVIIHVFSNRGSGIIFNGNEIDFSNAVFFEEIKCFIDGFLREQSVPIYFFISGFVFFLSVEWSREKYIQKLKNRVHTLLIPYLIWNTISLLLMVVSQVYFASFLASPMSSWNPTFGNILSCYWVYTGQLFGIEIPGAVNPVDIPLWFVRNLMIVVLCTPVLYRLMKRGNYWFVVVLGILCFFNGYFDKGGQDFLGFFGAFFFFSWGAYMSINRKDMLVEFGRYFRLSVFMYPILGISYVAAAHWCPEICKTIKSLNVFFGLLFAYNLAAWLLRKKYCKASPFLASSSFFIYVSHTLICGKILKILYVYLQPASSFSILFIHIFTVVLTLALLLSAFYLMRRYTPALLRVLTGRK